jgi:NADH-quinone oxidoreductase subunit D
MTLEKLLMLKYQRAQYLRVIVMELARITDHLICNSILGVDTGAYTGFLYVFSLEKSI